MKFNFNVIHTLIHKVIPRARPMPYVGYHVIDAETGEKKEHPNTEEYKTQVEDDVKWAFDVADKGVSTGQEASAEGERPRNLEYAHNRTGLAVRIFDELRRWRWNAMPSKPSEYVELEVRLGDATEKKIARVAGIEKTSGEGDEPETEKPLEAPESWEGDAGEKEVKEAA